MIRILHTLIVLSLSFFSLLPSLSFAEDTWNRVYLATYPRSGNHWMRYLIEEATHIATSSVYWDPDPPHVKTPFPWGGYCVDHGYMHNCRYPEPGEVVVVKTHFPAILKEPFDNKPYTVTIRILRHPIDSIYSFYVYLKGPQANDFKLSVKSVEWFSNCWKIFQRYWNDQPNVLTIRYEDLHRDPFTYLKLVLETIGYEVTDEDIQRAIDKHPPTGQFLKYTPHFTEETYQFLNSNLGSVMKKFGYRVPKSYQPEKCKEEDYILPMPSR